MKWIARYLLLFVCFVYSRMFLIFFLLAINKTDGYYVPQACIALLSALLLFFGIGALWYHLCEAELLICDSHTFSVLTAVYTALSVFELLIQVVGYGIEVYDEPIEILFALLNALLFLSPALPYLVGWLLIRYKNRHRNGRCYIPPSRAVALKMILLYTAAFLLPCAVFVLGHIGCNSELLLYLTLTLGCFACPACALLARRVHPKENGDLS